jgi:O-6-methylguanine DNA methyltransferase
MPRRREQQIKRKLTPFQQRVYAVVTRIPRGATMSYAQVASAIGQPGASRAVGNALNKNYDPAVPCHRVIRANGQPGGYRDGAAAKRRRLRAEKAI